MARIAVVHVSDLHFSGQFMNRQFGWLSGYLPHDLTLCEGLQTAVRKLPRALRLGAGEPLRAVCSGDLTAQGLEEEFVMANSFLRSKFRTSFRRNPPITAPDCGLSWSDDDLVAVPGNHDHWNGNNLVPPYSTSIASQHVAASPWRHLWISPDGALELELFGLDSSLDNHGVPIYRSRVLAQGVLSHQQLSDLETLMQNNPMPVRPNGPHRVRAIVLHHSLANRSRWLPGVVATTILPAQYQDQLLDLAAQNGVSVLLTGHTHEHGHETFRRTHNGATADIHELRCPSTLQGPATTGNAGFLLHDLVLKPDGTLFWEAWRYRWTVSKFDPWNPSTPWVSLRLS